MTVYLAAYDVELGPDGFDPADVEKIAEIHRRHHAPATFFIVGKLLESPEQAEILVRALDDELFDIQSHTYRHLLVKDNQLGGKGLPLGEVESEVTKTNELIARVFGRKVIGLRTPAGYYQGMRGEPQILDIMWRNGIEFLSADLRGPGDLLPSPLKEPFWYAEEGFGELLELPGHSWHDNVLKGYARHPVSWPPPPGFLYPARPPQTAEAEFEVYRSEMDYALDSGVMYYSPVLHPWSLCRVDSRARTVELLLSYAEAKGMPLLTFIGMYEKLKAEGYRGQ